MILHTQPKTFVIAIKGHTISEQQLEDCLDSAKKYNWTVEVFWGVDGRSITEDTWKHAGLSYRTDKPTMHRPGVQGCFLSHWALWQKCVNINEPIIILEHDAVIQSQWKTIDISNGILKLHKHYSGKKSKIDEHSGNWSKSGHAYCLSSDHAKILINFVKQVGAYEVDRIIGDKVISYSHLGNPSLIERQNSFSTTENI
jgi:GR25 family glycosyltransferase involved in LPS biosynthesis